MNVCGDTLCGVLNSQVLQTKLSVLHVQFSSSLLSNPTVDEKPTELSDRWSELHWRSSFYLLSFFCFNTTFLPPHLHCFLICSPSLFTFLFFFSLLASPVSLPLSYPSLSVFWLQNVSLSLYLDAPLLSPWFLCLYLTSFFFYCWRTDSQKRSKIHQCCIVAAFWSAWWVTTQPRAIIYKCVFINTFSIYM